MSIRAFIGVQNTDGTVRAIYCHSDGVHQRRCRRNAVSALSGRGENQRTAGRRRYKERNKYIDIKTANVDRRALCTYLRTLKDTATDIFQGNHYIDDLDACFLEDADYGKAFDAACMVLSYKLLNIYGANCEIDDDCIFKPLPFKEYDNHNSFLCCELAYEYGRQLHYIIAQKVQIPIENALEDEMQ